MRPRLFLSILIAISSILNLYADEIAIIPYRVNNPSVYLPVKSGSEYAKILSVASIIAKKNIEITSPRDIEIDLKRMKLSAQGVITGEDLDLLGRTLRIDYFLLGVLNRIDGKYKTESVLYSVRDKRVLLEIKVKADTLFKLAEKEIGEAFAQYQDNILHKKSSSFDALFLIDISYRMNSDWASVQKAICDFSRKTIDDLRINTRIYILPFSDRISFPQASISTNSILSVRKELANLKPAGGTSPANFMKSLRYSVKNVRWRNDASKTIIIISNSNVNKARMAERYAIIARKKGISIFSISLGQLFGDDSELIKRLSSVANGYHLNVSYHQKIFDSKANSVELYMENGRLFKSRFYSREWKVGLYEANQYQGRYGKPKKFIDEIFFDDKGFSLTPWNMPKIYSKITMENIINQKKLENNIDVLINRLSRSYLKKNRVDIKPIGKALVSDGKISFWIYISDKNFMNFLEGKHRSNYYFPLGIIVKKDSNKAHGITIIPRVKEITSDYIPERLKISLTDIVKRRDYYISRGLFYPPVWFVDLKVENIERFKRIRDIRE